MSRPRSIFENFNAKLLTTRQLIEGFIVNDAFLELAGLNHTLIVGPRGSGKTTLMKMLQVESLAYWETKAAEKVKKQTGFTGVFIPTDIAWHRQYSEILKSERNLDQLNRSLYEQFVLHVLECFTQALSYRICTEPKKLLYKQVVISLDQEAQLVEKLSSCWHLTPAIPSIRSLQDAIVQRSYQLSHSFSRVLTFGGTIPDNYKIGPGDLSTILITSVKLVNNAINENDGKWCFLFDELELAPNNITNELVQLLRGSHTNIIYKLSLVPYVDSIELGESILNPLPRQDYSRIELPKSNASDLDDFAKSLCTRIFEKQHFSGQVDKYFEEPPEPDYDQLASLLVKKDKDFSRYLDEKGIDADNLPQSDKSGRTEVRKVRWPLYLRNHYLKEDGMLRSYKTPAPIYSGFDSICRALEYNPRMIIGTMSKMVERIGDGEIISTSAQLEVLVETEEAFTALLNTISLNMPGPGNMTLAGFIERIGQYISGNEILGQNFKAEPKGSFIIDRNAAGWIKEGVRQSLNTGAMVRIVTSDDLSLTSAGRFRLSNIFSHKYKLPATVMRTMDLQEIFLRKQDNGQQELFNANS